MPSRQNTVSAPRRKVEDDGLDLHFSSLHSLPGKVADNPLPPKRRATQFFPILDDNHGDTIFLVRLLAKSDRQAYGIEFLSPANCFLFDFFFALSDFTQTRRELVGAACKTSVQ